MSYNENGVNQNDLFNNPMVEQAKKALTKEQKEEYRRIGEQMYNSIDFETGQSLTAEDPLIEHVAHITEQIKSGLHWKYLEENETKVMEEFYGKDWFKQFEDKF